VTKPRISARIAAIAESATLAVDAKAKALKAAGRPVIGFGAGEPDFPTPDYIVEAAAAATKVVANHRYSPTPGLPELREAIVKKTKRDSNYDITADQVLVTNGGKQAVYQAVRFILQNKSKQSANGRLRTISGLSPMRFTNTFSMTVRLLPHFLFLFQVWQIRPSSLTVLQKHTP